MTSDRTTEVLILGGGPAGSSAALRLLAAGITPIIVEREEFPRFHIGESMTGECGRLVRSMGFEQQMTEAGHPVKHGVSVFGARGNQDWWVPMSKRTPSGELAPSPTYQVRRSVFDKMLLDAAVAQGAVLIPGRAIEPLVSDDGRMLGAQVRTDDGAELTIDATITLDCSGQASFLANKGVTGPKYMGSYDKQIAVFTQVAGYRRDNTEGDASRQRGNTHIYYTKKFHWAWGIPIDDEVTSVGIVIPAEYFRSKKESRDDFVAREIHELNAGLADRVTEAEIVEPAHVIPNYSFQVRKFAGPGYICIGDSHRFVDPIFSFGMFVAIQEAHFAADAVVAYLAGEGRDSDDPFRNYMVAMEMAIDILEDTIDTFWENPLAFAFLVHNRYRDQLTDVFSGRIYQGMTNPELEVAMAAFHKLLDRERVYDDAGLYSVPIGSRYHEERAPLWNSKLDSVETTEAWLRDFSAS